MYFGDTNLFMAYSDDLMHWTVAENAENKKMIAVSKFSETIEQELASKKFLEENSSYEFVGKTNKKNLIFENKNEQIKITTSGIII